MKTFRGLCLLMVAGIGLLSGCTAEQNTGNPALTPAQPILLGDCPNLYKVSETLYRGAQPQEDCFPYLERMGIRTVIDLRMFHSDEKNIKGTSLKYISIPMAPWDPEIEEVRAFLTAVTDPDNQPVFVHCQHGSDRTGTLTAVYRMVIQGWIKERAIEEMTEGPFGFHEFWSGLPKFLDKLDIDTLRAEFSKAEKEQK